MARMPTIADLKQETNVKDTEIAELKAETDTKDGEIAALKDDLQRARGAHHHAGRPHQEFPADRRRAERPAGAGGVRRAELDASLAQREARLAELQAEKARLEALFAALPPGTLDYAAALHGKDATSATSRGSSTEHPSFAGELHRRPRRPGARQALRPAAR